jgi:serine protease AprX
MSQARSQVRLALTLALLSIAPAAFAQSKVALDKLERLAKSKSKENAGHSRVIIRASDRDGLDSVQTLVKEKNGSVRHTLTLINAKVATLPNAAIAALAEDPRVARISIDRRIEGANERTGATIGATSVRDTFGYDGSGVGVAVIDSGITNWHDDLASPGGGQRVVQFVDLVNGRNAVYDDYGHGTHVAGIIAGNGFDASGARTGVAPGASLIVIKALDASGRGYISDIIAALDYVVANRTALNIRVVNLSVATGVYESYESDPLTLAARRAVDAGVVVVAAAGNNGRNQDGVTQYGGITAPGNAPWVLTVGASSHMGTVDPTDDTIAAFSSRGPTARDVLAKPDLVAPGVGIESLSDPESDFYHSKSPYLLPGTVSTTYLPYLSLTGTSMAAPVVSGTVALMLQANPWLTPNAVKAILQYTARSSGAHDALTEGAGFLNAKGAVDLARFFAASSSGAFPTSSDWGAQIIWGNRLIRGGWPTDRASAWGTDVTWGDDTIPGGASVEWGVTCTSVPCDANSTTAQPWRADGRFPYIVWNSAWGSADGNTVLWGTADDEETVVWGTADDEETVVWGTSCTDPACEPIVW